MIILCQNIAFYKNTEGLQPHQLQVLHPVIDSRIDQFNHIPTSPDDRQRGILNSNKDQDQKEFTESIQVKQNSNLTLASTERLSLQSEITNINQLNPQSSAALTNNSIPQMVDEAFQSPSQIVSEQEEKKQAQYSPNTLQNKSKAFYFQSQKISTNTTRQQSSLQAQIADQNKNQESEEREISPMQISMQEKDEQQREHNKQNFSIRSN